VGFSRRRHAVAGFTLIELMIAMVLGLLMGTVVISIFLYSRRSFDSDERVMRMQDDARQAVFELGHDFEMAGFWADLLLPTAVDPDDTSLTIDDDCGPGTNWIYQAVDGDDSLSVTAVDNATGTSAAAYYTCIDSSEVVAGTDVVAIKRVAGAEATPVANGIYLRTNGTVGTLYQADGTTTTDPDYRDWEYRPSIYYIRNYANSAGDGIPTLCRKVLQFGATAKMGTECLAQGIENLQVEFGLDSDGDGLPNHYASDPSIDELQTAVTARIYVLARAADPDLQYTNSKTYEFANAAASTPADHYYRRVFSMTVGMHNLRSLRLLGS
jgi:type IV pilus assembly protein PilW